MVHLERHWIHPVLGLLAGDQQVDGGDVAKPAS